LGGGMAVQSGVMKTMAAACLLWASGMAAQTAGGIPEPPVYGQLYYWDTAARVLKPVPYEAVRVHGKREEATAEFRGGKAKMRFQEGALPVLVMAYGGEPAGDWVSRMYLLETKGETRQAPLGVWATSSPERQTAGAVPVRMEKHGKFSYRLTPPALRAGEYVLRSEAGGGGFTFGVDAR